VTNLETKVLDRETALERIGGDESLLREIARLFLDDYPNLIREIRGAIASCDAKEIERSAHSLKGAVANFAAESAFQAAWALEQIGRSGNLENSATALQQLEDEFAALRPALEDLAR
jgi:HPt (histidine-containing phosphotransfer) domain-containing protein